MPTALYVQSLRLLPEESNRGPGMLNLLPAGSTCPARPYRAELAACASALGSTSQCRS
jgi:hypothetical protein